MSKSEALAKQKETLAESLRLKVKCGGCKYLAIKAPGFAAPCLDLGKKTSSASCNMFEPDWTKAHNRKGEWDLISNMKTIGLALRTLPESAKHDIAYAIVNATEMRRVTENLLGFGLELGHPIVVNLSAPSSDYVNCYFSAIAIGVTKIDKSLVIYSRLNGEWVRAEVVMHPGKVYTKSAFKAKERELIRKGRINAPIGAIQGLLPKVTTTDFSKYMPPAMAKANKALISPRLAGKLTGKSPIRTAGPKKKSNLKITTDSKGRQKVSI